MNTVHVCALLLVALSLGACADRAPDDLDGDARPAGGELVSISDGDAGSDAGPVTDGTVTDPLDGAAAGAPAEPPFDTDLPVPETIDGDGVGTGTTTTDTGAVLDPIFSPGTTPPDPIGDDDDTGIVDAGAIDTGIEPPSVELATAPSFPGRPDAARLHVAMTRALGTALLDLNVRLAREEMLTPQQEECIGAFDPGVGEPLLAIDCERALATEPLALRVEEGALVPSGTCRASVMSGTFDGCVLALASVIVPIDYDVPERGVPTPVAGSGVTLRYAIDTGAFEIVRDPASPFGGLGCGIDATTGTLLPIGAGGADCDQAFRETADVVDALFASASGQPSSRAR